MTGRFVQYVGITAFGVGMAIWLVTQVATFINDAFAGVNNGLGL